MVLELPLISLRYFLQHLGLVLHSSVARAHFSDISPTYKFSRQRNVVSDYEATSEDRCLNSMTDLFLTGVIKEGT